MLFVSMSSAEVVIVVPMDGFDVMRGRGRGRYDMTIAALDEPKFSFLTDLSKAAWMPIVRKILGDEVVLAHKGAFVSLPGADTQVYHQDGVHLHKSVHKPCYVINVFIPLVDLHEDNGPTEFCVGTHHLGYESFARDMTDTPCPKAGTPIIFDYRTGHRGLGNSSPDIRPIVYLTYTHASSSFKDTVNFSSTRYKNLGELLDKPLSRRERALKREREPEPEPEKLKADKSKPAAAPNPSTIAATSSTPESPPLPRTSAPAQHHLQPSAGRELFCSISIV